MSLLLFAVISGVFFRVILGYTFLPPVALRHVSVIKMKATTSKLESLESVVDLPPFPFSLDE